MNQFIERILEDIHYQNNPYFTHLWDGSFEKEDFIETQIQFFFAVTFFAQPMAALVAKMPDPAMRMEIVRNIWEEHGEGSFAQAHGTTFKLFLKRIAGVSETEIHQKILWPEVKVFNTCLLGVCTWDHFLTGTAVLGIIEKMFCVISNLLGQAIIRRDWLTQEQMVHYNLHKELDVRHAQDFFDIIEPYWRDEENQYLIQQGIQLGASVFHNFYKELYFQRKKRLGERIKTDVNLEPGSLIQ